MAKKRRIVEGDYVEVNGMWGYVNLVGSDGYVRVNVDRDDGTRETVTYPIDDITDGGTWVDVPDEPDPLTAFAEALNELL